MCQSGFPPCSLCFSLKAMVSEVLEGKNSPFKPDLQKNRFSAVQLNPTPLASPAPSTASSAAALAAAYPVLASGKRVSFGPYISPEYIDKRLPPSTPVKKGAPPPNGHATPSSSLLKKMSETPVTVSLTFHVSPGGEGHCPSNHVLPLSFQRRSSSETRGVLKRNPNDSPIVKGSSGYRTSPRLDYEAAMTSSAKTPVNSPAGVKKLSVSPSVARAERKSLDAVAKALKTKSPKSTPSKMPKMVPESQSKTPVAKSPKQILAKAELKTPMRSPARGAMNTPARVPTLTPGQKGAKGLGKTPTQTPKFVHGRVTKSSSKKTWADVAKRNIRNSSLKSKAMQVT